MAGVGGAETRAACRAGSNRSSRSSTSTGSIAAAAAATYAVVEQQQQQQQLGGGMGDASIYKVLALEVLKGQSRVEEARDILTRVAKQVRLLSFSQICICSSGRAVDRSIRGSDGPGAAAAPHVCGMHATAGWPPTDPRTHIPHICMNEQVEPLMAKYKWRVPLLAEFLPKVSLAICGWGRSTVWLIASVGQM